MAASDIRKLREQYVFNPIGDISDGDMGMMSYAPASAGPMGGSYRPPTDEDQGGPFDFLRQPSTGPTFPQSGAILPSTPTSGQAGMGAPNPQQSPTPNQTLEEYIAAINKGYTPDFTDRDRLRKLMDAVPERKAPSFARTLAAAGLSVKAEDPVKTAESVMQAPYLRDMASWKEKTEPYYKTAELENRQNVNERTLMTNAVTAKTAADRLAEQGRQADAKNEVATKRAENDAIRARAYAAKNNGFTVMVAGNRIVAVHPNGQRVDLGDSGKLDEETRLDILGEWGVKQAEARGTAAVQTAQAGAVAGNRDLVVIDGTTYQRNPDRSLTPVEGAPSGMPSRVGTPSQNRTTTGAGAKTNTLEANRVKNERLSQAWQTDPVNKQYVKKVAEGKYDFQPRPVVGSKVGSTFGFGGSVVTQDDVDNYDAFRSEIDPSYTPPKAGGIGPGTTKEPPAASAKPGLGASPATVAKGTGANNIPPPPAKPKVLTEEEKTRAAVRAKIAENNATKGPRRQAELEGMLKDPNTSNQLRPIIQRELDELKKQNAPPPTPTGRIAVYDKNGKLAGHIPDTPEQRRAAAAQGLNPR